MRLRELAREVFASAIAARVSSGLALLVSAATCLAALLTVGQQAAAEQRLAQEFARPAARTLALTDDNDSSLLSSAAVDSLRSLDRAERVVTLSTPRDAFNGALGEGATRVSLVVVSGDVGGAITLVAGRMPSPGSDEVLVSATAQTKLGLAVPSGVVETTDHRQWSVVGRFVPLTPFEQLEEQIVAIDPSPVEANREVRIVADSVASVSGTQAAALAILAPKPGDLAVQSAVAAAATSASATAQLTAFGRSLLLLILGAGAFFIAVVVLADVLIHRRDLGRRRTLGITRADLVTLVALRTTLPSALGAVLAAGAGLAVAAARSLPIPPEFAFSVAALATITAGVAAIPPALLAAWRDPVAVMRTA